MECAHRLKVASGVAAMAAASLLAGCSGAASAGGADGDGAIELVMAADTNKGDPMSDTLTFFIEALEEELGDRVTVDAHYGGSIGDEVATIEALRAGQIDVVVVGSDISAIDPIFGILELPFLFTDQETVVEFLDGELGAEMSQSLQESAGLRVLSYGENGFRHLTNDVRPVVVPEDLKGLKLRVPEVPARVETFQAMGAIPTPMDFSEIYLALDQGVIDGQENPLQVIEKYSFDEVQNYLSLTAHVYTPASLTMNNANYEALPADIQEGIDAAAATAARLSREQSVALEEETVEAIKEGGTAVNEIDAAAFKSSASDLWEKIAGDIPGDYATRVIEEFGR